MVLLSLAAAVSDFRTRRIPNLLTAALAVFAVVTQGIDRGTSGAFSALALVVLVIVIGAVLHQQKLLGGGDVKLIAGCVAFLGTADSGRFLLFTALAGGVVALIYALQERRTIAVLNNIRFGLVYGVPGSVSALSRRLPYAVAVFIGIAATLIVRHITTGKASV